MSTIIRNIKYNPTKIKPAITILLCVLVTAANAQESEYEWRYGYQRGTLAPEAKHLRAQRAAANTDYHEHKSGCDIGTAVYKALKATRKK